MIKFAPLAAAISASLLISACMDLDDDKDNSNDSRAITAESENYRFEYESNTITGGVGSYTITVTAKDSSDLTGEAINSTPVMTMNGGMQHSTPVVSTSGELDENGSFTTQAYYLMGTYNSEGEKQGQWSMNVEFDDETVEMPVEISWVDGGHATLYGDSDDQINGMNGMINRRYYAFFEGKHHMNDEHMFSVFVAAQESMMSYPALVAGSSLSKGSSMDMSNMNAMNMDMSMNNALVVNTVTVELCLEDCMGDSPVWIPASASETKDGVYTISVSEHPADLSSIHLKLAVNGINKTNAAGTSNMGMISLSNSNTDSSHSH